MVGCLSEDWGGCGLAERQKFRLGGRVVVTWSCELRACVRCVASSSWCPRAVRGAAPGNLMFCCCLVCGATGVTVARRSLARGQAGQSTAPSSP